MKYSAVLLPLAFIAIRFLIFLSFAQCCSFSGYQLLKVVPHSEEQLAFLKYIQGLEGKVSVKRSPTGGFTKHMSSWLSASVVDVPSLIWGKKGAVRTLKHILRRKGLTAQVKVTDGNNFLGQITTSDIYPLQFRSGMNSSDFDLNRYHRLEEIEALMLAVAQEYPELVEIINIGQTFEGRNLTVLKVTSRRSESGRKKGFWLEFGIHAREWITHATGLQFLISLLSADSPIFLEMLEKVEWYFILVANPDGYAYTWSHDRFWRKTRSILPECRQICDERYDSQVLSDSQFDTCAGCCRGVDPNRNWDVSWGVTYSYGIFDCQHPCCETYSGKAAFSEPEVRAMANFLLANQHRINMFLSVHSYSQVWLIPYAYSTDVKPHEFQLLKNLSKLIVDEMKQVYGQTYQYGQASKVMYEAYGTNMDWVRNATLIDFAFGVELRGDRDRTMALPAFCLPPDQIAPQAQEFLVAIKVLYQQIVIGNVSRPSKLVVSTSLSDRRFIHLFLFIISLLLIL